MANTPYQTTATVLRAGDFTALSITAGTTYSQADIVNIKTALTEIEALLKAAAVNAQS